MPGRVNECDVLVTLHNSLRHLEKARRARGGREVNLIWRFDGVSRVSPGNGDEPC